MSATAHLTTRKPHSQTTSSNAMPPTMRPSFVSEMTSRAKSTTDDDDDNDDGGGGSGRVGRGRGEGGWKTGGVDAVGENEKEPGILANDRPDPGILTYGRLSENDIGEPDAEVRAPIKLVDGRPWSPNVYLNLRLIGMSLDVAWSKAFIRASHF
jgi:hypothetical protein